MWYRRSIPIKNLTKGVTFITTGKESTFFPSTWIPQNIIDTINETFNNAQQYKNTDLYRGKCNAGFEIEMKIINNKIQTAYPSLSNF